MRISDWSSDVCSSDLMRQVFSDENLVAQYLAVEAALARVQGRLGVIPEEAAREIDARCRVETIDFAELRRATELVGYPILPLVQIGRASCRERLCQYV